VTRLFAAGLIGALAALVVAATVLYVADLEIVDEEPANPAPARLGIGTGEPVTVPSLVGLDPVDAQRKLEKVDLLAAVSQKVGQGSDPRAPLIVVDQVPPAGTEIDSGRSVEIQIAEK
jgi:hypothetical protein